jgi:hypothetical protein
VSYSRTLYCKCGHPQAWHERGVDRCKRGCGCEHVKLPGRRLRILELLDPGVRAKVAPTYRVECPECLRDYTTRAYPCSIIQRRRCAWCSRKKRSREKRPDAGKNRPHDLPSPEAFAARKEHGTRTRYASGCRCPACREANNAYARLVGKRVRAGLGDPLVDAARARRHLERLSRAGVGRRTVSDVAGVPSSSLGDIRRGVKVHVRRSTERKILSVGRDCLTDAKCVSGDATRKRIAWLLEQGYTRTALAAYLGSKAKTPALQIAKHGHVTARTRARVEKLVRDVKNGERLSE